MSDRTFSGVTLTVTVEGKSGTLVLVVPSLPLPDDAWDLFLSRVRERLIKLTSGGYQIKNLEISPEYDGQRLVQVWVSHEYSIVKSVVWWQKVGAQ